MLQTGNLKTYETLVWCWYEIRDYLTYKTQKPIPSPESGDLTILNKLNNIKKFHQKSD